MEKVLNSFRLSVPRDEDCISAGSPAPPTPAQLIRVQVMAGRGVGAPGSAWAHSNGTGAAYRTPADL